MPGQQTFKQDQGDETMTYLQRQGSAALYGADAKQGSCQQEAAVLLRCEYLLHAAILQAALI